jgi:hypothetical protein
VDGVAGIADFQCRQLLRDAYHRMAPVFDPGVNVPLDAARRIPELVDFAGAVDLDSTIDWLERNWM